MSAAREQLAAHALVDLADEYISGAHRDSTVAQRPEVLREFVKWVLARGLSSLRAPQSGPAMNAFVGTYGKGNNGCEWWVTSRVGQWRFDNEADARMVCDLLNAGSGAETP